MANSLSFGMKLGLSKAQAAQLAPLKTPEKIQDFICGIPVNFEPDGDTCKSVAEVLNKNNAHCIEAAYTAACALWMHGKPPYLMDLQAAGDDDHVVTVFQHGKHWGAISKSNHIWLRWRDPVYRNLRELALSYFHEYVSGSSKTMTAYSVPFDLRRFDPTMWVTGTQDCWDVAQALDDTRHYKLVTKAQARNLRPRDKIELEAGKITEFKARNKKNLYRY